MAEINRDKRWAEFKTSSEAGKGQFQTEKTRGMKAQRVARTQDVQEENKKLGLLELKACLGSNRQYIFQPKP